MKYGDTKHDIYLVRNILFKIRKERTVIMQYWLQNWFLFENVVASLQVSKIMDKNKILNSENKSENCEKKMKVLKEIIKVHFVGTIL